MIFKLLLVVAIATAVSSRQITVYDDEHDGPRSGRDYSSDYSGGSDTPSAEHDDDTSGFADPIDFTPFFTSGFSASPVGAKRGDGVFNTASSDVQPFALISGGSVFPADPQASATTNNGTGFTSPDVKFQSFFDISGGGDDGFRSQDFIKRPQQQEAEGTAPADFFAPGFGNADGGNFASNSDFAGFTQNPSFDDVSDVKPTEYIPKVKPTVAYTPVDKYNGKTAYKYNKPTEGKSSYPGPANYRTNQYTQTASPAASGYQYKPTNNAPVSASPVSTYGYKPSNAPAGVAYKSTETYPSKSTATYNPTGPYLSKPNYKSPPANVPHYRVNPSSEDYESKSGYPKKVTEFYPTKIGTRPTRFQTSATEPHVGKSSYPGTQEYYQKLASTPRANEQSSTSTYSPYLSSRASYDEDYLPPTSDPFSPSEYGKDAESHQVDSIDYEESKSVPSQDAKNCRRIEKQVSKDDIKTGRVRRDAMTCYLCDDPKTGGSFEKCSYESDPEATSQSYFHGHANRFTSDKGVKPTSYRYRRSLRDYSFNDDQYSDFDSHYTYSEPLIRVVRQEGKKNRSPSYGSNYGTSYDDYISKYASPTEHQYRYEPEHYTADSSKDHADEYKASATKNANNKDCKTVVKGTMTCSVCQNPKTGGSSEQCSYATNPADSNYFVARQSSFNTKDKKPVQQQTYERSSRPQAKKGQNQQGDETGEKSTRVPFDFSTESSVLVTRKSSHKGPLDVSAYPYGADRRSDESREQPQTAYGSGKNYDDYFKELFPELAGGGNKKDGQESKNVERGSYEQYRDSPRSAYQSGGRDDFKPDPREAYRQGARDEFKQGSRDEFKQVPRGAFKQNADEEYNDGSKEDYEEVPRRVVAKSRKDYNGRPVADYKEYAQEYEQAPTNNNERKDTGKSNNNNNNSNNKNEDNGQYYKSELPDYFSNTEPKKDLERVLGEFSQKDRTDCKKVIRDKMTCYQCVDKKGMQHEECMFVAASEPKSQHLAYHEVKEFSLPGLLF